MNNCFKHDLKERLENRKVWSSYFLSCLKHWEISEKVSEKYYKDKFLLSIVLKLYFLPINLIKFFYKIRTWHYYLKTETELEVLRKEIEENDKIEPELLAEFPSEDKEHK